MDDIFRALADPTSRGWYLGSCFAIMVLPIIAMSYWYHSNINRTAGGRRLMTRQGSFPSRWEAAGMAKDISAGHYGDEPRRMQNRLYVLLGLWLATIFVLFGTVLWADEVNRTIR